MNNGKGGIYGKITLKLALIKDFLIFFRVIFTSKFLDIEPWFC